MFYLLSPEKLFMYCNIWQPCRLCRTVPNNSSCFIVAVLFFNFTKQDSLHFFVYVNLVYFVNRCKSTLDDHEKILFICKHECCDYIICMRAFRH